MLKLHMYLIFLASTCNVFNYSSDINESFMGSPHVENLRLMKIRHSTFKRISLLI